MQNTKAEVTAESQIRDYKYINYVKGSQGRNGYQVENKEKKTDESLTKLAYC